MFLELQRAYVDDLKIHDLDDPAILYSLRSAKRTVSVRRTEQPKPNRQGVIDRTAFINDRTRPLYGPALFDLAGYVTGATDLQKQDNYDALERRLMGAGIHTFRFLRKGRAEEEQVDFTLAGGPDAPSEGYTKTIRYAVTIEAADPRIYSATLKSSNYDPTASLSGGGMAMPLVFPLVFTTTTVTELEVTNQGNAPSPAVFTIKGPVANPIIDNDTTGESLFINYTLGAADTVIVDMATRSVYLNGALRRDLIIVAGTTWFDLQPGLNALRLRGSGMAVGVTLFTVSYRDARR